MARVLVAYGTTDGQTARIAEAIAEVLRHRGHEVDAVDINDVADDAPGGYDAVIFGASVHLGKHQKSVTQFVRRHRDTVNTMPSAFFSVSLAALGDDKEAEGYVEKFRQDTGWQPDEVAMFGGALLYTQYGFVKRRLVKTIAQAKPGILGADTSRDYIYTEWDAVGWFAERFAKEFEAR